MERAAFSLRGVERAYGIDRRRIAGAIASGELPASRLGKRRLQILRADVESWLRSHPIAPSVEHRVALILEREERSRGGAR